MSVPVRWPGKTFFYPIGNTPAVNLTQCLPPEGDASILLLGCGDPRSILYTLFGESNKVRKLDFTCCDVEPAVLARNTILLTLVMDGRPIEQIWNIFYHFNLDNESLALLTEQCNILLSISSDLRAWSESPYYPNIQFSTSHTLASLRRHWKLYIDFPKLPKAKLNAFKNEMRKMLNNDIAGGYYAAALAAGLAALDAVKVTQEHFALYRKTGVVHPVHSIQILAKHINPTFVYSILGDSCSFHYASYPPQGFHVGEAFASTINATQRDLVDCVTGQFKRWCGAWKDSLSKTTIRLAVADAVVFCRTLWNKALTGSQSASLYASPWVGAELVLDGGEMPTSFDVIDTSNLMDFIGALNVLIATAPLLTPNPASTLQTEALVGVGKDPIQGFVKRLCADIPTFACLLGIAPIGYLSGFHTESNVHEIIVSRSLGTVRSGRLPRQTGYHERISWKLLPPVFPSMEPEPLAHLLYNTYVEIFTPFEDLSILRDKKRLDDLGSATFPAVLNYHRHTFIIFLFFLKGRFHVHDGDWDLTMRILLALVFRNTSLTFGTNFLQEICVLMHTHDIHSTHLLSPYHQTTRNFFAGWGKPAPPVVCVVFVIPKTASGMRKLLNMHPNDVGTAMFELSVKSEEGLNMFSTIQVVFGKAKTTGRGFNKNVEIEEDEGGWASSASDASVIVSAWMPNVLFSLIERPSKATIRFNIHSSAGTIGDLAKKFGVDLVVHEEGLLNDNSVHILASRPNRPRELEILAASAPKSPPPAPRMAKIKLGKEGKGLKDMAITDIITNVEELKVLQADTKVEVVHTAGLCNAVAEFGSNSKLFTFPLPVESVSARLRIERESGYLEVGSLPIFSAAFELITLDELVSPPIAPGVLRQVVYVTLAPVLDNFTPVSWNIHYVNLASCPTFKQEKERALDVCQTQCSMAMSNRERDIRERGIKEGLIGAPESLAMLNVKDTLHSLFVGVNELEGAKYRLFSLTDETRGGMYATILINRLCLDLSSHTITIDCNVVFHDQKIAQELGTILQIPPDRQDTAQGMIKTSGDETLAWLHLFPAFVERCRTWSHNANCEYKALGKIPISSQHGELPLCHCGLGQNLGIFFDDGKMAELKPFATRAAISPLYAVSYLDIVGDILKDDSKPKAPNPNGCAKCGTRTKEGKPLLVCTRCKKAKYCGVACQRADWETHKHFCKKNSK